MNTTVRLGDIAKVVGGGTPDRSNLDYWGGEIPWVTVKDVQGERIVRSIEKITPLGLRKSASNLIPSGSIVIPTRMALGRVAINELPIAINQDLKALIVNSNRIDRDYLFQFLRAKAPYFESRGKGATVKGITLDVLTDLQVPAPSIVEQRRIASVLDKADGIKKRRSEALGLGHELLRSAYLDMFGDPLRDTGGRESLGLLCSIVRGSSPRPQGDPRYFGGPVPRLMVADLTRDGWWVTPKIDSLTIEGAIKSRPVEAGTIVMAVSGNVGVVARLKIDACIHDGFVALNSLDVTRANPNYLLYSLHMLKASHENRKAGAIFQNLTTNDIKSMSIPLPPIDQQNRFGDIFEKCLAMINRYVGVASDAEALSRSLAQRAFAGQL